MTIPQMPSKRRYATLRSDLSYKTKDGTEIKYIERRIIPPPERFATLFLYTVVERDRLDNIAYQFYRDPQMYWLICDANAAQRPEELEARGLVVRITMPEGLPAPVDF